MSRRIR